jgi:hypothetical protein
MSEEETKVLGGRDDLLQKILTKLEVLDTRLQVVESKIDARGFDTKPIWEKALVAIMEVKEDVRTLDRKIEVFNRDMLNLRAEQLKTDERITTLEAENEGGGMTTIN